MTLEPDERLTPDESVVYDDVEIAPPREIRRPLAVLGWVSVGSAGLTWLCVIGGFVWIVIISIGGQPPSQDDAMVAGFAILGGFPLSFGSAVLGFVSLFHNRSNRLPGLFGLFAGGAYIAMVIGLMLLGFALGGR